jgi:hypothetical protein
MRRDIITTGKRSAVFSFKVAEIWLKHLEASFSPRRHRFNARTVYVELVEGNAVLGQRTIRTGDCYGK